MDYRSLDISIAIYLKQTQSFDSFVLLHESHFGEASVVQQN
jgi:hypothetical protein